MANALPHFGLCQISWIYFLYWFTEHKLCFFHQKLYHPFAWYSLSLFCSFFLLAKKRNRALVSLSKRNKNRKIPRLFQVKRFVAYNIQKALSFNISYALKLHEKSFRRPSETNENSFLVISFLYFYSISHSLSMQWPYTFVAIQS